MFGGVGGCGVFGMLGFLLGPCARFSVLARALAPSQGGFAGLCKMLGFRVLGFGV